MGALDLVALGLAAAVIVALAVVTWVTRRRQRSVPRLQAAASGASAELASALSLVLAGDHEAATEVLRRVVQEDTEAIEVYVLLGNLQREAGHVERAIRIHRSVLQRQGLTQRQRVDALTALARDHESAGFLDRALGAYGQVAQLVPDDARALVSLRRLYERAHAWPEALGVQERLVKLEPGSDVERRILALLHDRVGRERLRDDPRGARKHFDKALVIDPACVPALLHLGDAAYAEGRTRTAWEAWSRIVDDLADHAWIVLLRLEGLHRETGDLDGFITSLRRLAARRPDDWRVQAFLATRLAERGANDEARDALALALRTAPSSPTVQRAAWRIAAECGVTPEEARARVAALGAAEPFLDSLACSRCRYRTLEPRWRCPHCHRWGAFVDETPRARTAPAGGRARTPAAASDPAAVRAPVTGEAPRRPGSNAREQPTPAPSGRGD